MIILEIIIIIKLIICNFDDWENKEFFSGWNAAKFSFLFFLVALFSCFFFFFFLVSFHWWWWNLLFLGNVCFWMRVRKGEITKKRIFFSFRAFNLQTNGIHIHYHDFGMNGCLIFFLLLFCFCLWCLCLWSLNLFVWIIIESRIFNKIIIQLTTHLQTDNFDDDGHSVITFFNISQKKKRCVLMCHIDLWSVFEIFLKLETNKKIINSDSDSWLSKYSENCMNFNIIPVPVFVCDVSIQVFFSYISQLSLPAPVFSCLFRTTNKTSLIMKIDWIKMKKK